MSPVSEIKDDHVTITSKQVLDFLRENPNFLQENPAAIDLLLPPRAKPRKGEIADFQAYMIERLKADKEEVINHSHRIVETSRANANNQQRVHSAILRLLEANSFDDFIQAIITDLSNLLDVDIAVLVVEADGSTIPHIHSSGIRLIPSGTADKWMDGKTVLLQDHIAGIEPIYGGGAKLVQSQILLRVDISMGTPPALLAFGSRDPNMFQPGQATDQITFLARVIERCFRIWLHAA